jgi:hypothetical protein
MLDYLMKIISRDEAIRLGLKRYFTGTPCKYGHVDERMVSNWRCRTCLGEARLVYLSERRRTRPGSLADQDQRHNERYRGYKKAWLNIRRAGPACPSWADTDRMVEMYAKRPPGMSIDHIVPLQGTTVEGYPVSGLHVSWNLQYLPWSVNIRKRTRMRPEDTPSAPSLR